jgi:hypothetical protein
MKYFRSIVIIPFSAVLIANNSPAVAQQTLPAADSLRVVLPVDIKYDDRIVTPYVNVTVNGKLLKAVFDTGSSGLRMLKGAFIMSPGDTLDKRVTYVYGDNAHKMSLKGKVRTAEVSFDKLKTSSAISIMCIDSAKYGPRADWIATGDSAVIRSNHFRGCSAIMGVGLRRGARLKGVESPLDQVPGNGKFIVLFPGYGGEKGSVIINPSPLDESGFMYFRLMPEQAPNKGWMDNKLQGCVSVNTATVCLPVLLDSGNPDFQVFSSANSGSHAIPPRNYVTLRVSGLADSVFAETGFNVSDARLTGKDYVYLEEADKEQKMVFGIGFFFRFDVLYDQQNGIIGIRKKLKRK